MADLGSIGSDPCSNAYVINSKAQIVGTTTDCHGNVLHMFLWQGGGPMLDLNTFVPPGVGLQLTQPIDINDGGEITTIGLLPNGDQHVVVLMPCVAGTKGCIDAAANASTATKIRAVANSTITHSWMPAWHSRLGSDTHRLGASKDWQDLVRTSIECHSTNVKYSKSENSNAQIHLVDDTFNGARRLRANHGSPGSRHCSRHERPDHIHSRSSRLCRPSSPRKHLRRQPRRIARANGATARRDSSGNLQRFGVVSRWHQAVG